MRTIVTSLCPPYSSRSLQLQQYTVHLLQQLDEKLRAADRTALQEGSPYFFGGGVGEKSLLLLCENRCQRLYCCCCLQGVDKLLYAANNSHAANWESPNWNPICFFRQFFSLRARCTNVVQLWTRVKSKFEPSSALNCIAPKQFKRWSPFNSEPPSDHRSNFDLGSTRGYACALGNKYSPIRL